MTCPRIGTTINPQFSNSRLVADFWPLRFMGMAMSAWGILADSWKRCWIVSDSMESKALMKSSSSVHLINFGPPDNTVNCIAKRKKIGLKNLHIVPSVMETIEKCQVLAEQRMMHSKTRCSSHFWLSETNRVIIFFFSGREHDSFVLFGVSLGAQFLRLTL